MSEPTAPRTEPAPGTPAERVLLDIKPAVRSIVLRALRPMAWCVALGVAGAQAARLPYDWAGPVALWAPRVMAMLGGLALGREVLVYLGRRYLLTSERIIATRGVLRRTAVEIPLRKVQQLVLDRTLGERVLGLGTLGVTSAGSQVIDLAWVMIADPLGRLAAVRGAIADISPVLVRIVGDVPRDVAEGAPAMVIGLAGGIGAGKSAVAAEFGRLGFEVVDADAESRAALDRPEVRATLVKWWGGEVLGPEGTVDRKAVAKIVFGNPKERQKLEALVHPIVKKDRARLIDRARARGRPGVVIDAPLLFEAGSDAECDYVVFVDAPPEQRLERVRAGRGWTPDELARRESAQIPLEEKRRRSDVVVVNDAHREALAPRVRAALDSLASRPSRRTRPVS